MKRIAVAVGQGRLLIGRGVCVVAAFTLCAAAGTMAQSIPALTAQERSEGWTSLFDGKTLEGWVPRGDAKWVVQNGEIVAETGEAQGHLATVRTYGDFRLRVEFFVDGAANSGVFLRAPETGAIGPANSYEVNIFDKSPNWPSGSINELSKTAAVPNTAGKWNTYDITAQGDHIVATLNGVQTVDLHVPADALAKRQPRGGIALQYGGAKGVVRFRNLRILAK